MQSSSLCLLIIRYNFHFHRSGLCLASSDSPKTSLSPPGSRGGRQAGGPWRAGTPPSLWASAPPSHQPPSRFAQPLGEGEGEGAGRWPAASPVAPSPRCRRHRDRDHPARPGRPPRQRGNPQPAILGQEGETRPHCRLAFCTQCAYVYLYLHGHPARGAGPRLSRPVVQRAFPAAPKALCPGPARQRRSEDSGTPVTSVLTCNRETLLSDRRPNTAAGEPGSTPRRLTSEMDSLRRLGYRFGYTVYNSHLSGRLCR